MDSIQYLATESLNALRDELAQVRQECEDIRETAESYVTAIIQEMDKQNSFLMTQ